MESGVSVTLKARNGNELELAFVRDRFPEAQDAHGDDEWCTLLVRAATADDSWEESASCLNAFELRNLAEWLEAVGGAPGGVKSDDPLIGGPEEAEIELLHPELRFTVAQQEKDGVGIRVYFHLPDRPEEFNVDVPTDEAEYIDLFMERPNVLAAAATLRSAIDEFEAIAAKDDITGEGDEGVLGLPDDELNIVDRVVKEPPGAGRGEDNAGER